MKEELNAYYLKQAEPNKSCLLALREIILDQSAQVIETQKWGMPCFCVGKKPFCYLWTDKKTTEPYILIVDGKLVDHPALEMGSRAKMKTLPINPNDDLPMEVIREVLGLALGLYL